MPREAEPSLNEKVFLVQALQEGHRLDGRELEQFRKLELSFGEQYGVADVTLGKTRSVKTESTNQIEINFRPQDTRQGIC